MLPRPANLLDDGEPVAVVGGVVVAGALAVALDERHRVELLQAATRRLQVLAGAFSAGGGVLKIAVSN